MTEQRITSRQNPQVQQLRRLLSSRRLRDESGLYVADGVKLLREALAHGVDIQAVFLADGVEEPVPEGPEVLRVPRAVMDYLSPMETPQGVLLLCRKPEPQPFEAQRGMLLLDGLQDPGNVGTVLRTADAFNIPVALLEGCADPYSCKTLRASMGAVFRRTPVLISWETAERACRKAGIPIAVTALSPQAADIRRARLGEMAVVIGSEGRGVRREILDRADEKLIIPMNPHCESLNAAVAAAIVMWQMQ